MGCRTPFIRRTGPICRSCIVRGTGIVYRASSIRRSPDVAGMRSRPGTVCWTCSRTKILRTLRWRFPPSVHRTRISGLDGFSMIRLSKLRTIAFCLSHQLALRWNRTEALRARRLQLRLVRTSIQSAASSIIADARAVVIVVVVDVAHIDVTDVVIDPRNRAVVIERAPVPIATLIAVSEITVAVIHPAIETYVRTPIAAVPAVSASEKIPISRRPQRTHVGCKHPRSRHPVIASRRPVPISGGPDVVIAWAVGLLINRQLRWRLGSINLLLIGAFIVVVAGGVATRLVIARLIVLSLVLRRRRRGLILAVLGLRALVLRRRERRLILAVLRRRGLVLRRRRLILAVLGRRGRLGALTG